MKSTRTSWQVTRSVWYALFMREALAKTTGDRMDWFWMLFEPVAMVVVMVGIRAVISMRSSIGGVDFIPWFVCGLFGFFLFRENMMRSLGAVAASRGLFAYRQVKPVDPIFIRCGIEGLLKSIIFLVFIFAGQLLAINLIPDAPLYALFSWFSLWFFGLGVGLTISVVSTLVPEVGKIIKLLSMPLMLISGVMFPLNYLPHSIQSYLLFNPIVHGIENLRLAFFSSYRTIDGISMTYLWYWTLGFTALGLLLHLRFSMKLRAA